MKLVDNRTDYVASDLIRAAKRENNNKRSFLLVNPLQAKHVPVIPEKTTALFRILGDMVFQAYKQESLLIIGFAETATAIGAVVAHCCGRDTAYLHTTRELRDGAMQVIDFREEHSHASQQLLYCRDWEGMLSGISRVVFVEDEVTTGKTILNFIEALKKSPFMQNSVSFSVASIVNAMADENLTRFDKLGIPVHYLMKIDKTDIESELIPFAGCEAGRTEMLEGTGAVVGVHTITGMCDPRMGVNIGRYQESIEKLGGLIVHEVREQLVDAANVLVIGTEECMYPAILFAKMLNESCHCSTWTHSTTRSPILPIEKGGYPLHDRYCFKSFYEEDRVTYLYNLNDREYDGAVVITDSQVITSGYDQLFHKLQSICKFVRIFQWVV